MYIAEKVQYHCPSTLNDLFGLLESYNRDAKILAGGTDLILQLKLKKWQPTHVIDIKNINLFNFHGFEGDQYVIGSTITLTELLESKEISQNYPALWTAIYELADVQIRNRGTLVGNLCNASPAADTIPALFAYGAKVSILSPQFSRVIPIHEFIIGPGRTLLNANELVDKIYIPKPNPGTYSSFQKLGRLYDDIALINAAVCVQLDEQDRCVLASIMMGAVGPTVLEAKRAKALLIGRKLSESLIKEVAEQSVQESNPISDIRASKEYRQHTIGVLVSRCLTDVMKQRRNS